MTQYVGAIDQGTTGTRFMVFNHEGQAAATSDNRPCREPDGPLSSATREPAYGPLACWPRWFRGFLVAAGLSLTALLVTAAWLDPDPTGHGTHRQLGFPPCTFVQLFGVRCPSCGMTTAWAHTMNGNVAAAWRANPGGVLLAGLAAMAAVHFVGAGWRGRWLPGWPGERTWAVIAAAVVAVTLVDWGLRFW